VRLATILHDVGKVAIPDSVLNKSGQLNPEEQQIIRSHVETGVHILEALANVPMVLDAVRFHHERYDGAGYPTHLQSMRSRSTAWWRRRGFRAMTRNRPYRKSCRSPRRSNVWG
jgi:putative nucleotidyltransferase with HDIG domain